MRTATKERLAKPKTTKEVDARHRIEPRGLCGMFKGRIILNGTDEEVFNLGLNWDEPERIFLDTHILVWALQDEQKLNKNIKEDIEYFQHTFYASVVSLHEIIFLIQEGKIKKYDSISDIIKAVQEKQIQLLDIKPEHIEVLEKLSTPMAGSKEHKDQFDRTIISQGIAEGLTVISADSKFPLYEDKGFYLLENI